MPRLILVLGDQLTRDLSALREARLPGETDPAVRAEWLVEA